MPTFNNYSSMIFVTIAFIIQICLVMYFAYVTDLRKNWPKYRCNPSYWIFSEDMSKDFSHCTQSTHLNTMGFTLQPMTYILSAMSDMGGQVSSDVNNMRKSSSHVRSSAASTMSGVYSVFMGLVINMQKMTISMQDMVAKLTGVMVTLLYLLDGSNKTMASTWKGPTGQMVRSLSCFHPKTRINLFSGKKVYMKNLCPGDILHDGARVHAVLRVNPTEDMYKIRGPNNKTIYVTGSHYIWCDIRQKYIMVRDHLDSRTQMEKNSKYYSCLITSSGKINIGGYTFLDWEDDNVFSLKQLLSNIHF